ncbi:hypothetical protein WA588_005626, partial [Blastocystis sp. NMH]
MRVFKCFAFIAFHLSSMSATVIDYFEPVTPLEKYKIVFLGDPGCGKTSIITRFIYGSFDTTYQSTIGIDFLSKTIMVEGRGIRLQLWDTAGQERFRSLIPSYIRDSNVAAIVYDVSNRNTFDNVLHWYHEVANQRNDCRVILVGNKSDLQDSRVISTEEGQNKAAELKAMFVELSAKEGTNVNALFKTVVSLLPKSMVDEETQKYIRINIDGINSTSSAST